MLGLVVNPVAGIGGPAGLAGSDGDAVQRAAAARGAHSRATARAAAALAAVAAAHPGATVLTAGGGMGEDAVRAAGLAPCVVHVAESGRTDATTAADTTDAVRALVAAGATLVLFAGGDGTARDVAAGLAAMPSAATTATADAAAALGIPAGVKMYSPVFAVSPQAAGAIATTWLDGPLPTQQREVLDVDEAAMRRARVDPALYATMTVPYREGRTQARKAPTPASEHAAAAAAARAAARMLRPGIRYFVGPGSTMAEVAGALGLQKSPLGVDVVLDGRVVRSQASEQQLLAEAARGPAQAVVTIIGGQGFLLGRGNQQLSAAVLRALGPRPLLVVAPEQKLIDLHGRPLLVDTGDPALDRRLAGFVRVVTGAGTMSMYPVAAAEDEPPAPAGPAHHPPAPAALAPEPQPAASDTRSSQPEGALHAS